MRTRVLRRFDSANAVYVYDVQRWATPEEVTRKVQLEMFFSGARFSYATMSIKRPEPYIAEDGEWWNTRTFPNREDAENHAARLADGIQSDDVLAEFGTGESGAAGKSAE